MYLVLWVAPRMLGEEWFEKGVFSWGWLTGTVAMSIARLRIIDPGMNGGVLDDYAIAYVPGSITDVFIISMIPLAMVHGFYMKAVMASVLYLLLVLFVWKVFLSRSQGQPVME